MVMAARADAAHVMMVAGLRCPRIGFVADDLCPVLAQLAIHRRLAILEFADAVTKRAEHPLMIGRAP